MLHFFRKYQKFFFLFTTVIVVSSFAFFGTYQVLAPLRNRVPDEVVFRTRDGKAVKSSHFNQMVRFLSLESEMAPSPFRPFAGNYFNDGVLTKDFFQGGLASVVFEKYRDEVQPELTSRMEKERSFTPFVHASAPYLSAEVVWSTFAPEIKGALASLQTCQDPTSDAAFEARQQLFLAEKRFPPAFLTQVLRYQERESQGLTPDPRLSRGEIALFGYRDLADWFGPVFIGKMAKTVIECAAIARQKGYKVTEDEALSDLLIRSEQIYQKVKDRLNLPVSNSAEFFAQAAHMLQFDEAHLVQIWQEVLLFRRLFNDVSNSVLVDHLPLKEFYSYANEYATIELYQMPEELQLTSESDLKAFEGYLKAVAPSRPHPLALPTAYDAVEAIESRAPELVGQRFVLEVASISKKALQGKVSVKSTWDWEVDASHWKAIVEKFPELGLQKSEDSAARQALLDKMDAKGRTLVDAFARAKIVEEHPEWIDEALAQATLQEKRVLLRPGDEKSPLPGISDLKKFASQITREERLERYTQDGETFYRIRLKEKPELKEVLTFAEAKKAGVLSSLAVDTTPLVEAMKKEAARHGMQVKREEIPLSRFLYPLSEQREEETLWKVCKKMETVTRGGEGVISLEEALAVEENALSPIKISPTLGPYCFRLLEKRFDRSVPIDKMFQAQEMLADEVKQHYLRELL